MRDALLFAAGSAVTLVYWVSICVIGIVILRIAQRKFRWCLAIPGIERNVFLYILSGFAVGVLVLSLFSLPLYVWRLPALTYTIFYLILAVGSLGYCLHTFFRQRYRRYTIQFGGNDFWIVAAIVALACLTIVFDYIASALFGTILANGSDSYVHIARILGIVHYGFSPNDGFYKNIIESRYSINAIYSLYVPPVQLLHALPADVWNWSLGFFRFMQWVSIGALGYFVASAWLKLSKRSSLIFSLVSVILGVAYYAGANFVAAYPNTVVNLWLSLLVIGVSLVVSYQQRIGAALVLIAAVLLAFTHPTYSLMAAIFLGMLGVILLILDSNKVRRVAFTYETRILFTAMAVMLVTPIITSLFPNRMPTEAFNFGAFPTVQVFGTDILRLMLPDSIYGWFTLSIVAGGYVYLLWKLYKRRLIRQLILVGLLLAFIYLLAYNPLFMAVVHHKLPIWLVDRFWAMNVLQRLGMALGLYALLQMMRHILRAHKRALLVSCTLLLVVVVASVLVTTKDSYKEFYNNTKGLDPGYPAFIHRTYNTLGGVVPAGSIVVTDIGDGYFLPAVIPVYVIAIDSNHATPVADSVDRSACNTKILTSQLNASDLKAVNADYVILAKWGKQYPQNKMVMAAQPRFSFVKETSDFSVYRINKSVNDTHSTALSTNDPCYQYNKVEGQ